VPYKIVIKPSFVNPSGLTTKIKQIMW